MPNQLRKILTDPRTLLGWGSVVIAAAIVSLQLLPTSAPWLAVAQSLTPWVAPVSVFAILMGSWARRHRLAFAGCVSLALAAIAIGRVAFGHPDPAPCTTSEPLTVVAANLWYRNDDIDGIGDALLRADADLIAMSETDSKMAAGLANHELGTRYPYRASTDGGMVTWSRWPIVSQSPTTGVRGLEVLVDAPPGIRRVVSLHPPPPVFQFEMWTDGLDAIETVVDAAEEPTLVVGDFNASLFHPTFREAVSAAGLYDAFVARGRALTMTWPVNRGVLLPFVAIDHVLVDRRLAVTEVDTQRIDQSDHLAVIATVSDAAAASC